MKKSIPLFLIGLGTLGSMQSMLAQNVTSANITSVSPDNKAAAINVKLTGNLTQTANGDFRQLRDLCYQMAKLDLSSASCTNIPKNALHSRHNLQTLVLPNNVQNIGSQAFFACDALSGTINMPNTLRTIGASAFAMCKSLGSVYFQQSSQLVNIGSYAFKGCESLKGEIRVPKNVVVLRDGVFEGCSQLTGIILPDNLQSIGTNTFSSCSSLTGDINMGRMLTRIGASAFADCTALQSISMPRALQYLGDAAFMNCTGLTGTITLPGSIQYFGKGAFAGCTQLEAVVLPAELTKVQAATFAGCTALKNITLYAEVPPTADATAFAGIDCSTVTLNVPEQSIKAYREDPIWSQFNLAIITAVNDARANAAIEVETDGNRLWVKHLPVGAKVQLFDAQGKLQATVLAQGETSFDLPTPGIYIVNVNGRTFKIKH